MSSLRTSCVDFISSVHGEQRRLERMIEKRDLQAAVKYGAREEAFPHPKTGERRLKFTYNGVVYITDLTATREVTSWALADFPLHKFDIDEDLYRQIAEQKRRISSGEMVATSHTILIVDQSGSMKNSDVMGHRSRSRGAYYTIANEMIAQPLINDQLSFTDVVSIVEMRDEAVIKISKEPITWELHNKLVDLADDPFSAQGQGNYLPALCKAFEALNSVEDDNCALVLFFLSDGGPSDISTSSKYFRKKKTMLGGLDNRERCFIDILRAVSEICSKFRARLTFGAFGFAHEHTTQNGKVFDLLRAMTQIANQAGANGIFSCGLDTVNLRKALYSMSTSLLSTRTDLSSLAGGSMLRISGQTKVKRTDIVKDVDGDTHNSFHYVQKNNLTRVDSRRQFDRERKKANIIWDNVALMHPSAAGIRVKVGYLGKGAERECREMSEITIGGQDIGQRLVGKFSIHHELNDQFEFHEECALTQFEAGRISKKFNEALEQLEKRMQSSLRRIEFLQIWFYKWDVKGGTSTILCEKRLDSSRYKKWNDNKGGVDNLNKQLREDIPAAVEEVCLDAIDEGDEERNEYQEDLGPVDLSNATRIIDDDVPQAFSHWSWQYTRGHSLVCDLQGVLGTECFHLTDPAIHSSKQRYGKTDLGRKGHHFFFATHKCNPLCHVLRLRHPGITPREIGSFIREQFMNRFD
jgi:hypothetical protein